MRVCSASAARVLTLFSLALLSSHSFILANAQNSSTDLAGSDAGTPTDSSTQPAPPISSSSSIAAPAPPTSSSAASSPQPTTSSQTPTSSSTKPSSTAAAVTSPTSDTQSSSSTPAETSSSTSQTSSSSSSSASSVSSSSASSSSSTSSSTSSSSSSTGVTLVQPATTLVAQPTASRHVSAGTDTTSYGWLSPTASDSAAAANNVSAAHKSFFDNKGAVAGTFSVVGIVAVGAIIVAVIYAKRRAARLQDEEDMTYFEKYNGGNGDSNGHDGLGDLSFGHDNPSEAQMTTHAAHDAYPDRSMHYGLPTMDEYAHPQPMGMPYGAAATGAGMEYPAGTAYARAQAQQGQQYQYDGYGTAAATTGYGQDYNAQNQYQDAYYESRQSPSSPSHPYADPRNSPRHEGAPAVPQQGSYVDLVHGEAR